MNPLTNVKNIQRMNELELNSGLAGSKTSWHEQYKDSAWIFVGGLPYDLSEGDIICVFSQYGEIVNINLVRDKSTGKSKGYCFICYEDQRSTILAVDNLNGIKILNRTLRVDHVQDYKKPKETGEEDEITVKIREEGVAPKPPSSSEEEEEKEEELLPPVKKVQKEKKKKKKKKSKKKRNETDSESSESDSDQGTKSVLIKKEKEDSGYVKYSSRAQESRHAERDHEDYRKSGGERDRNELRDRELNRDQKGGDRNNRDSEKDYEIDRNRDGGRERDGSRGRDRTHDRGRSRSRERSRERDRNQDYSRRDGSRYRERRRSQDRSPDQERSRNYGRERDRRR